MSSITTVLKILLMIILLACSEQIDVILNQIPLPEHPRPDFQREEWMNLNGTWEFQFDSANIGLKNKWYESPSDFRQRINVPFSWGSKLSGVNDEADIGWYKREIEINEDWNGKDLYVVFGASDWLTMAWVDGNFLGEHKGGYTPFEFNLKGKLSPASRHSLVIRVDDTRHDFQLYGKQGYGRAAGIWQTIYLEAREEYFIDQLQFIPNIDNNFVRVKASLNKIPDSDLNLDLHFQDAGQENKNVKKIISASKKELEFLVNINKPRLWSLEDPYLYEIDVILSDNNREIDKVSSYFGMRKISVEKLPGTDFNYIALNNVPIYLQLTLDQAYHPEGYYTYPSDDFIREDILRTKNIGLNGQRIHVKIDLPRKLYWADKLGILIMADIPNSWGPDSPESREETEKALRGMLKRDFNHPSIFSWVNFNETWGLRNNQGQYTKEIQEWVKSIYHLTKELDPTRLVEDNSTNNLDHVATDINSWHAYLPGHRWNDVLELYVKNSFPGSSFNFVAGSKQGDQPLINSECGNVWGYEKNDVGYPTGDVDYSWDYHQMINAFRKYPQVAGWLYTEHHDVINEWNGYYKYDRSNKVLGLSDLMENMTLNDFHSPVYVTVGDLLCEEVGPGELVKVPLYASYMTNKDYGEELIYKSELYSWNSLGDKTYFPTTLASVKYKPWLNKKVADIEISIPSESSLNIFGIQVESANGEILHRNFTSYFVDGKKEKNDELIQTETFTKRVIRFKPDSYSSSNWSQKEWKVLDGLKVCGAGYGFFEYKISWPPGLKAEDVKEAELLLEISAKQLFGKDVEGSKEISGDFMLGKGTHDPSHSPNSYPMTDSVYFPSVVKVSISGADSDTIELPDDPADHRGILSWFSQKRDFSKPKNPKSFEDFNGGELHEAGSYGYFQRVKINKSVLERGEKDGSLTIKLEVDKTFPGGLAIYGKRFGRYPLDPTLVFSLKK